MNVLETKNVSYRYPDGTPALEDVNFSAAQGKMVALLGPNGAGKSTLFLHFNGILRPSAGTVMVENVPLTYDKKSIMKVRQKVGIVFQNPDDQLFAPTVEEDVAFGPLNVGLDQDEVERRVAESLERVGMAGFEKKPPHHLSGGQKKRVAIAGILAMSPEIMVLDEPTSGLDPKGASRILHLLHKLNQEGMTIVISTHDVDLVPLYASQVYIISEGHIIKEGTPQDVFSDEETIRNANLRLPRIAHLMEILQKKDELPFEKPYPLTIGEARKKLLKEFDE
ncbi:MULTISPECIES: ATP-binding cassette domain-containing protein [Methanobacterium]|jgi:cobalt/nickel transport system ATP-binding protein|uniref:ABC transporter ATP-binding protein n=1 Tax=Methanobacterium formicicum TaxID=2162 RepID=A0A090I8E5_METFO|nr:MULTISPECIES: ATP-binding cassette domain-containing protein [Methanobacterium]AIS32342.1 cobalt ABC transporter ATP-binding protein CbiO1 [Methanobacterium formicicum]KUK74296.1 MAG: Cobalt transporter ATP-binding subunit [Methanobacterium sp. 42_16]MBF4473901.1 ATP-binding cassette domain-containing protein [Methanobacterium formicicum]MDG3546247.1 ATP-binding cassette domain-containing protein [Methanobacterium formicicum]MDH2658326.1 ATP-binding cassette domain-containing protein [Metha